MNTEQLEAGKKLADKITTLEAQLAVWQGAQGLIGNTLSVSSQTSVDTGQRSYSVQVINVNFEVLKALTIQTINTKLETAKAEFAAL